jgi:hypothetical protein
MTHIVASDEFCIGGSTVDPDCGPCLVKQIAASDAGRFARYLVQTHRLTDWPAGGPQAPLGGILGSIIADRERRGEW